jgi:hypothetical protein
MFIGKRAASEDFYLQYVREKANLPFAAEKIEQEDIADLVQNQNIAIRARVEQRENACEELKARGWTAFSLPEEFVTEGILKLDKVADKEILLYDEHFDCMRLYVNDYYAHSGKKGGRAFPGWNYQYRSPNYTFCLFVPELNLLFYKELDG